MRALEYPSLEDVPLVEVLCALANPIRLEIVRQLADAGGVHSGEFAVAVNMSTLSHHLRVLRLAGLLKVIPNGSHREHILRRAEVEAQFPGVLESVLAAMPSPVPPKRLAFSRRTP